GTRTHLGGGRQPDRGHADLDDAAGRRLRRDHRRRRRGSDLKGHPRAARPHPAGRGAAQAERLPGLPHPQARAGEQPHPGHHAHRQEPAVRPLLGHEAGGRRIRHQALPAGGARRQRPAAPV
ncbi:MAG: hypothetical protein AVDCRST_MAG77-5091, partial [uncultured Chloroflexi bacterium]